ncbi:hypothetical protein Tsp_05341 [Trichinella spiralis]|nr:hypothetical protein Tsp_05341 [Trichinella spiralis]
MNKRKKQANAILIKAMGICFSFMSSTITVFIMTIKLFEIMLFYIF